MSTCSTPLMEYVEESREEMIRFLRQLVETESFTENFASQTRVQKLLAEPLEELGFYVRLLPGCGQSGGHLYARPEQLDPGVPFQLLLGHCDTVWPPGTIEKMPFRYEENELKGPGVFDMKGGLVQLIYALKALSEFGCSPEVTPVVFVNSDEERGSRESSRYVRMLARRADRAFVLEPALGLNGKIKTRRKGAGRFEVDVTGKGAHAGLDPGSGNSAIVELSHVIQALHELNDPERGISVNVGTIEGGVRPNVVAPDSKAMVDVRVERMADVERIRAEIMALEAVDPGVQLEISGGFGRLPMEKSPESEALWRAVQSIGDELGLDLDEGTAGGASDGNTTSQYTPTLDGLGAVGDGAHAEHEFIYVDRMLERTALLARLLLLPGQARLGTSEPKDVLDATAVSR